MVQNYNFKFIVRSQCILNSAVQFRSGFRYGQYEEHPVAFNIQSGQQETSKAQPEKNYESHPPFGLLNKNRDNKKVGKLAKERFDSLGIDGGLRKFQKATNSLRRSNIENSEGTVRRPQPDVCEAHHKIESLQNISLIKSFNDYMATDGADDVDTAIDKKIKKLIWINVLLKYRQALDSVFAVNVDNAEINNVYDESEGNEDDIVHEDSEAMTK